MRKQIRVAEGDEQCLLSALDGRTRVRDDHQLGTPDMQRCPVEPAVLVVAVVDLEAGTTPAQHDSER